MASFGGDGGQNLALEREEAVGGFYRSGYDHWIRWNVWIDR